MENILDHASEWPVLFSPVSACRHAPCCLLNSGNTIHVQLLCERVSQSFTEQQWKHHTWKPGNSVVPLCKCNTPTMTLQITRTRTLFIVIAQVAVKNAFSKGCGSTLTILLQVVKLPANWDYFPREDHLVLAAIMYGGCPGRFDFLQNKDKAQSWSFLWVTK